MVDREMPDPGVAMAPIYECGRQSGAHDRLGECAECHEWMAAQLEEARLVGAAEARAEVERLQRDLDAAERELHRIACGVPIESDGLCRHSIGEALAQAEVERLRAVVESARERVDALRRSDRQRGRLAEALDQRDEARAEAERLTRERDEARALVERHRVTVDDVEQIEQIEHESDDERIATLARESGEAFRAEVKRLREVERLQRYFELHEAIRQRDFAEVERLQRELDKTYIDARSWELEAWAMRRDRERAMAEIERLRAVVEAARDVRECPEVHMGDLAAALDVLDEAAVGGNGTLDGSAFSNNHGPEEAEE
jgi:hypothetical protein